jgi:hypothetical protein
MMSLARYPKTLVACSWIISLSVFLLAVVMAEFGGAAWIFVLSGIWMVSLGLPTSLILVSLATLWGDWPMVGRPSLLTFAVCVTVLSMLSHTLFVYGTIRLLNRRRSR